MVKLMDVWIQTKKRILKKIEDLEVRDDNSILDESVKLIRMDLICQLRVTDKKIESLFKQKARDN